MKEQKKKTFSYILLGIFLLIAYQLILPNIYFHIFHNFATSSNFWISNITYAGYYFLIVILLILVFHKSIFKEWKDFWNHKKEYLKKALGAWGKGLLTMAISNLIVVTVVGQIAGNEAQNRELLGQMPLYAISTMCLFGPFIEEIVFRKSYRKAFQNKYTFAFVTSFIFASLHVLNGFETLTISYMAENCQQLLYLLPYGSLAFFFALAYYETDNIFTSTLAHIIHNTFTIIIIFTIL